MFLAHFLEIHLAALIVDAFCRPGTSFQILAMILVAKLGYPGTGGRISLEDWDLNFISVVTSFSLKRQRPRGSMDCLDFQTVKAVMEATASFRHFIFALCRVTSERILSVSFVLVFPCLSVCPNVCYIRTKVCM